MAENEKLVDGMFELLSDNAESMDQDIDAAVRSIGEAVAAFLGDKDMRWLSALKQGYEDGAEIAQEMFDESEEDFDEEDEDFDLESDLQSDLDRTHAHHRGEDLEDEEII